MLRYNSVRQTIERGAEGTGPKKRPATWSRTKVPPPARTRERWAHMKDRSISESLPSARGFPLLRVSRGPDVLSPERRAKCTITMRRARSRSSPAIS
jgi:hypothetical protein